MVEEYGAASDRSRDHGSDRASEQEDDMTATAASAVLDRDGLDALVGALVAQGRTVVGPTVRDGAIVLAELTTADALPHGWCLQLAGARSRLVRRADAAASSCPGASQMPASPLPPSP